MRTKYILHTGNSVYELKDDDIRNWDDIRCSYKRAGYDGVVRSFTSQFEFVNQAKSILQRLYVNSRFDAKASISVHTMNDRWEFEPRFECELDFSTIRWDLSTLKINSVDNSLAATIKANKGTKYEFIIGSPDPVSGIIQDRMFRFDRVIMQETLTYELTGGSQLDDGSLMVTVESGENPYVGNVGNETTSNHSVEWNDDQTGDAGSYLFKAMEDVEMSLDFDISWREDDSESGTNIGIRVRRGGVDVNDAVDGGVTAGFLALPGPGKLNKFNFVGNFPNSTQLISRYPNPTAQNLWALVNGKVWEVEYNGREYYWGTGNMTPSQRFTQRISGNRKLHLKKGDEVYISSFFPGGADQPNAVFHIVSSRFFFMWRSRGKAVDVYAFAPVNVAKTMLRRIAGDSINVDVSISGYDPRIPHTYILAAESIRGIAGARLYSSFSDFCDWMSAVFGYVYYIDTNSAGGDVCHMVRFVHRSEVMCGDSRVRRIDNCKALEYGVDSSVIYSAVTAGYEKKDYDSVNGRDEFNFSNTYSTGCHLSDKSLSLVSKYRADCYGIEFAAQKRGSDTTDSTSDKDVFFVLCTENDGILVPDRTTVIGNAISDTVFNGAFSPMSCIRANAGYIGLQGDEVSLSFASSTGNSAITIDGEQVSSDIKLDSPIATCGEVTFTTDYIDDLSVVDGIIEVVTDRITYQGYLKELDIKYARSEAAKYKLIVKEIKP